jgi:hypothetical protein
VALGCYKDVVITNKTYKVGSAVRNMEEIRSYSCYNTEDMRERNGTVVISCRVENQWSHYVAVYMLLDNFKAYVPLMVVKGDPQSICKYGEEAHHIKHQTGWHVWQFPHEMFWELPPRHNRDRADTSGKFSDVDPEHCGK